MDIDYLLFLQELREATSPLAEQFFLLVSNVVVGTAMAAIPLFVYWCLDKRRGFMVMLTFGMSVLVNNLVKAIACVSRPWVRDPRVTPSTGAIPGATGYSFPSGHTQSAMSIYGTLGWEFRHKGRALPVLGAVIVSLVAFSRNFLGVHTPQDVAVAILESALLVVVAERIYPWLEEADDARALRVLLASMAITVAYLLFCTLKPYPFEDSSGGLVVTASQSMVLDAWEAAGFFLAVACGWWIERRYVSFSCEGTRAEKAVRFVVGVALVVASRYLVAAPIGDLLGPAWKKFLKALVPIVVGMAGVPALFPAIHGALCARRHG